MTPEQEVRLIRVISDRGALPTLKEQVAAAGDLAYALYHALVDLDDDYRDNLNASECRSLDTHRHHVLRAAEYLRAVQQTQRFPRPATTTEGAQP